MEIEENRNPTDRVRYDEMGRLLEEFSRLVRLTGTGDCDRAAEILTDRVRSFGVSCELLELEGYFSDPLWGELILSDLEGASIPCKPRSACRDCPEGIEAEIVYDRRSRGEPVPVGEETDWYGSFRGKIVLSWNFYEDYVKRIEAHGAAGLIHIWSTDEEVIHEETVGPVWGTPTEENARSYPALPVVGIRRRDGLALLERLESAPSLRARIRTRVEYRVARARLPLASIPGRSDDFVLLSGHYDSWHEGVTDNATGNALCLETARVLAPLAGRMERGLRIAWWPGHSNGRYMGSTWFCDHFHRELRQDCVAHLNVDSPGSKGGAAIQVRTTRLEGAEWGRRRVRRVCGDAEPELLDPPRGADQSFWGVDIPIHLMYKFEPLPGEKRYACPGSGGGWWWHAEEDRLDKVDPELLLRDTRLYVDTVLGLTGARRLPADLPAYFGRTREILSGAARRSGEGFDLSPVLAALNSLERCAAEATARVFDDDRAADFVVRRVGGTMNRLMYSSCSKYGFDPTFPARPFQGLRTGESFFPGVPGDRALFARTGFLRQVNRFVGETEILEGELGHIGPGSGR